MIFPSPERSVRLILYGGGSALLLLDVFFLLRASLADNFVPVVPVLAGIFTAAGLLFLVYAEQKAREEDRRDHTRLARVAHQLTNPLQTLRTDLDDLLAQADALPAAARLKLKRMGSKTSTLLDNIRDVFLTLQAQDGPLAQEVRAYDVCALVAEAYRRALPLASARNVELIYAAHCANAPVKVDRRLMLTALAHLIENAIFYTRTPGLVNVAVTRGARRVRVIIQDRGIGISRADAPLVERPFARGTQAEQYDSDGIGLGVALTKLILREFKGRLVWASHPRRSGSQFEIHLPLVK
ncbi:MAG: HAMP domain-containing histidine kinase [Candidatus Andersenbacteria bacterium]|nr:HAMP domain-containing histidine kinase [Candidatus Andersenbacteria bacterium]